MYPHFIAFKNREVSLENHKAGIRHKLKKIKESYVGYGAHATDECYDFPKMTDSQLEAFRIKLQQEKSKERINRWLLFLALTALGILILYIVNKELLTFLY